MSAERAFELHGRGLNGPEIARLLGVSKNTIYRWLDPAFAERGRQLSRAAKRRRTGTCRECGGVTRYNGTTVNGPSAICALCSERLQHEARTWTREAVIDAIQRWAAERGKPPSANDWLHADPEGRWPNRGSVYSTGRSKSPFRQWGDAIEAAGFPRTRPCYHGRFRERVWTEERTLEALRSWSTENGHPPTQADWARADDGRPTTRWVTTLFGSWNIGLALAGLPTLRQGQKRPR